MSGIADRRIADAMRTRLAAGPAPFAELLAVARASASAALDGREGAFHALLHRLVRADALEVVGRGARGAAVYALPGAARAPSPDDPVAVPPPVSAAASRAALAVASGVRDPGARGRVVADVLAHRGALEAEGRLRDFGSGKAARILLARVDRSASAIVLPENGWERFLRFLRHEAPSMGATLVVLGLVWRFGGEFRVIPSNSMQPALKPGDRVVVQKLFGKELPGRWQIVVFHKPTDGVVLVKRVVGLPGERLAIEDGDLYVDGKLAVKPDDVREAVREPLVRSDFTGAVRSGRVGGGPGEGRRLARRLPLPPRALRRRADLRRRERQDGDEPGTAAARARPLRRVPASGAPPRFASRTPAARTGRSISNGAPRSSAADAPVLCADGPPRKGRSTVLSPRHRPRPTLAANEVELSYVDGVARLISGGNQTHAVEVPTRGCLPTVFVSGGVRSVAIDRDVHYTNIGEYATDPGNPFLVPQDCVFCLGDHSAHSADCRLRSVGPVPLDLLIGPVRFRVWPPSRIGRVR